ncbi:MAG: DNA helicase PcrA [Clostridia bacterium]|jgi:DNA helicase-2/ATP-dependent DNA helicase PcrA
MDLGGLNPQQKQAVLHTEGPLLIFAGAGSGKTRVLTHRVAYLIEEKGIYPGNILAITFTNKAAREMKDRIQRLVTKGWSDVWISTFHSTCVRILRRDIERIGYTRSFVIYDDSDQISVIKDCLKELNLNEKYYPVREVKSIISDAKNRILSPDEYAREAAGDFRKAKIAEMYKLYEKKLKDSNALDFDDLIIKTLELFVLCPDILDFYQKKFKYIHVDEYQDTNDAQYQLVRALAGYYRNICVVGDDDQSIYGWRGANIQNILDFEKDFPDAHVIKLEQNYRSSRIILDAANHVIQNNYGRKQKRLWTNRKGGSRITLFKSANEHEEAQYVCEQIEQRVSEGKNRLSDFCILYRVHAQSRVIEEMLMRFGIPYRIYGGLRFYDRKEIKDILAFLRIIINPADNVSLKRIINTPKRGIGDTTIQQLEDLAAEKQDSMFGCLLDIDNASGRISVRTIKRLRDFTSLIRKLMAFKESMGLKEFVECLLEETGYLKQFLDQNTDEAKSRIENIREFVGAVKEYEESTPESTLEAFLENVALVSDIDTMDDQQNVVTLMTLHSVKGLEFHIVFMTGMEEGIFPHSRAFTDEDELEEERRLCYVGITRAEDRLFLTYSMQRTLFGFTSYNMPSRFISEIPNDYIESLDSSSMESFDESKAFSLSSKTFTPSIIQRAKTGEKHKFSPGDKIHHDKFGIGTVVGVKGQGDDCCIKVAFPDKGIKELLVSYAPIKLV